MKKLINILVAIIAIGQIINLIFTMNISARLKKIEKESIGEKSYKVKYHEGPNIKELRKIKLPKNPSKEEIKEYIGDIMILSREQTTFSPRDPQVEMLTKIGNENIDLLMNEFYIGGMGGYYIIDAIKKMAKEEDKEKIIDNLPNNKELIKVIYEKGWQEDAKDILIKALEAQPDYLPTEWIRAIAFFKDPNTYKDLKKYMVYGSNRMWTYRVIKDLPGIGDLSDTVGEAWKEAKKDKRHAPYFVSVALEYGHKDALRMAVDSLDYTSYSPGVVYEARELILQYAEIEGDNEEVKKWYKNNKDRLVFDKEVKKFIIKR